VPVIGRVLRGSPVGTGSGGQGGPGGVSRRGTRDALWIALAGLLAPILSFRCAGLFLFPRAHEGFLIRLSEVRPRRKNWRALQLLDAIAEGSSDAIFAKDREGRYLLFNREAARVTGKRPYERTGQGRLGSVPPRAGCKYLRNDRKIMEENLDTTTVQETSPRSLAIPTSCQPRGRSTMPRAT